MYRSKGTLRMYIDYKALNANTIIDAYPILYIDNVFNHLGGSLIFNKIVLAQGCHQVLIAKGYEHGNAFQMYFKLFLSGCIMHLQYSKDSYIRYFESIWMSFALCI